MPSQHLKMDLNVSRLQIFSLLTTCAMLCNASKILGVATIGARSHTMNLVRIGRELAERGHTFSMLISQFDSIGAETLDARTFSGLHVITFHGPPGIGTEAWASNFSRDPQKTIEQFLRDYGLTARALYSDSATLHELRQQGFDLILQDTVFWPGALLGELLDIPVVEVLPLPIMTHKEYEMSFPNPLAYAPQMGLGYTAQMNFWQRIRNYVQRQLLQQMQRSALADVAAFTRETGQRLRFYDEGVSTSVAIIAPVDWALEFPQPLPPRIHFVGPVLAEDAKPVTADLAAFLNQGLPDGQAAIFVSMGTLARLSLEELTSMALALSRLPNPVLWKLDPGHLPDNVTIASLNLGTNIKTLPWAPQNDILGHPSVKAFVMQAGINSLYEAAYHAKPVVSIPLVTDQVDNAAKASYHGFGLTVQADMLVSTKGEALHAAVTQILAKPSYTENAIKVSKRLLNKPRKPVQLAADVVEQALATGGDRYLETQQHKLTWWQMSLLDVKLFLTTLIIAVLTTLGVVIKFLGLLLLRSLRSTMKVQHNPSLASKSKIF